MRALLASTSLAFSPSKIDKRWIVLFRFYTNVIIVVYRHQIMPWIVQILAIKHFLITYCIQVLPNFLCRSSTTTATVLWATRSSSPWWRTACTAASRASAARRAGPASSDASSRRGSRGPRRSGLAQLSPHLCSYGAINHSSLLHVYTIAVAPVPGLYIEYGYVCTGRPHARGAGRIKERLKYFSVCEDYYNYMLHSVAG